MDTIASDHPLTREQQQAMRILAGLMIPASTEYLVPGADDETIFADILRTVIPEAGMAQAAVQQLDEWAGTQFSIVDLDTQKQVAERFRVSGSPLVGFVVALVTQCYYRDDRVMQSLDMEPRPPFPLGFEVEEGDWSLLDPVRLRKPLWRKAP